MKGIGAGILFFSGLAALAHQVVWTRRLVDLLGASSETFSIVVGTFFVGLAIGSAWASLYPAREGRGWRRVAMAEWVVGVTALVPLLGVEFWVERGAGTWGGGGWGKWVTALGLIGPPSLAMGLVFPAVSGVIRGEGRDGNVRGLYAWNTLGGLAGVGLVFFAGLPGVGMRWTGLAASALNLVVGGWAWRQRSDRGREQVIESGEGTERTTRSGLGRVLWLSFGSGFGVIGSEVVLQLQFAQVAINSHFSSAAVLGFVLAGLAMAAFVVGRWGGRRDAFVWAGVACLVEPWLFALIQPGLAILPYELPPVAYFLRLTLLGAGSAVGLMALAGLAFPSLLGEVRGARAVAALLAVNGLGGWLGAELMLSRVLPGLGLWCSMHALAVLYGVMACVAGIGWTKEGRNSRSWIWGVGLIVVAVAGIPRTGRLPQVGASRAERLVKVAVGREGVVATVTGGTNDWRILMNNTYTLGGSRAWVNQERQALLPILLHGGAQRVALLGFATGSTTAGATMGPGVDQVDAFELSPLVAQMAGEFFRPWNRGVIGNPRVHLEVEDARLGVARANQEYDVVVGDLFLPWRTGEGRMYAREHFRAVRRALKTKGLFCQWLPLFQLTRAQYDVIARTFAAEFPNSVLIRGDFYADLPIVGLVGTADSRGLTGWDWARVDEGCRAVRGTGGVADPLLRHAEGIAMAVLGPMPDPGPGPMNTLANGWVEWEAGRNIVGMRAPWFIGVPWAEYAREVHRNGVAAIPQELRSAHDAGQFFLTLEVAAMAKSRVLANLEAQVSERLPSALRWDRGALWESWPSRVKVVTSSAR